GWRCPACLPAGRARLQGPASTPARSVARPAAVPSPPSTGRNEESQITGPVGLPAPSQYDERADSKETDPCHSPGCPTPTVPKPNDGLVPFPTDWNSTSTGPTVTSGQAPPARSPFTSC